jgi:hypothetical protein
MQIINAAPKSYLLGVKDESGAALVVEQEQLPTHLPHIYSYTERGVTLPQVVIGDSATRLYGANSFDLRGKFATHQTLIYQACSAAGNSVLLQRVIPTDAPPPASLVLWADILEEAVYQYERNLDGSFKKDGSTGQLIPILDGGGAPVTVPGYTCKWVTSSLPQVNALGETITQTMIDDYNAGDTSIDIFPVANLIGSLSPVTGDRVNSTTSTTSTRYPIRELEVNHQGSYGNRYGIRLWPATAKSSTPADETVVADNNAFLYSLQIVYKADEKSSPTITSTLTSEQYIQFADKEGAINSKVDQELWLDLNIIDAWQSLDTPGQIPLYGPFGRFHNYYDNIVEIATLIQGTEVTQNPDFPSDVDSAYMVNTLTGVDIEGIPYFSYQVLGPSQGGILLNEFSTIWATGGGDGTMTNAAFDSLVATQLTGYGDLEAHLLDGAKYPSSIMYDSGFTLETKKKLFIPMSRRKDMFTVVSTQDISEPANTPSEESSLAIALQAAARLYPESEIYGTATCRAAIVGHAGKLLGSQWRGIAPLTVELASKFSAYMSSGTGIWNSALAPDQAPNNQVATFRDVNSTWKSDAVRSRDWTNGLIWVQSFDRRNLFFPALQTVYPDDTSVLNNIFNAFIAIDLEKVCNQSWAELTGNAKLTSDQFIERSDELIKDKVKNKYDGRVVIVPRTFISAGDTARGYSYSCEVTMYANTMKTVAQFTIVARRRDDLTTAQ